MKSRIYFFVYIILGGTIGQLAAEVIAPSLPFIDKAFGVDHELSSLTVSYYTLGMALPLIIFGILADRFNRKKILVVSSYIGLIGSFVCVVAPNIYLLILGRFIQGVGLAGVAGTSSVLIRDKFSGVEFAKNMSYLGIAFALMIDFAPFIGGFLQEFFSFRIIFIMICGLNLVILYMSYQYNDLYLSQDSKISIKDILHRMRGLFKNTNFVICTFLASIIYSIFMAYILIATFVIQNVFHRPPIYYGTLAICLSMLFATFAFVNGKLIGKFTLEGLIFFGFLLNLLSGVLILFSLSISLNLRAFIITIIPMFIGSAFIFSNVSSLAFMNIKMDIGLASTLNMTIRFIVGFIVTYFVGLFANHELLTLGLTFVVLSLISIGLLCWHKKALTVIPE